MTKETKKTVKPAKAKTVAHRLLGTPVIVRANVAGVHCGILESYDPANCALTLKDAYRLWRVYTRDASGSISDIAANGLKLPLGQHSVGARLDSVVIVNPPGFEIASATEAAYASVAEASHKA
jgi:hypothetical protein